MRQRYYELEASLQHKVKKEKRQRRNRDWERR